MPISGMKIAMCVAAMGLLAAIDQPVQAAEPAPPIGVEPCDSYLGKYRACIETKAEKHDKDQQLAIVERSRRRWAYLAANPATKPGLPSICDATWESMKLQLSIMGCE